MFAEATSTVRESTYGIWARSPVQGGMLHGNGSGFAIRPGILVTCAHVLRQEGKKDNPIHQEFYVIRAPEVGTPAIKARLIAEHFDRDLALLEIEQPSSEEYVELSPDIQPRGRSCGSLGFPLCKVRQVGDAISFNLHERYQATNISAYHAIPVDDDNYDYYEIDRLMYPGSSGCPGYLPNAQVVGMQSKVILEDDPTKPEDERAKLDISLWVRSLEIIDFAREHDVL